MSDKIIQSPYLSGYYIGVSLAILIGLMDGVTNVLINICPVDSLVVTWWSGMGGLIVVLPTFPFDDTSRILTPKMGQVNH